MTTDLAKLDTAPKDATYLLALATDHYGNRRWLVIHWAQGGGEDQPPFRGWFYWSGGGHAEIDPKYILGWHALPKVPSDIELSDEPKPVTAKANMLTHSLRASIIGGDTQRAIDTLDSLCDVLWKILP